jgi:hypothetical protein
LKRGGGEEDNGGKGYDVGVREEMSVRRDVGKKGTQRIEDGGEEQASFGLASIVQRTITQELPPS